MYSNFLLIMMTLFFYYWLICLRITEVEAARTKKAKKEYHDVLQKYYYPEESTLVNVGHSRRKIVHFSFITGGYFFVDTLPKRSVGQSSVEVFHIPFDISVDPPENGNLYISPDNAKRLKADIQEREELLEKTSDKSGIQTQTRKTADKRMCGLTSKVSDMGVFLDQGMEVGGVKGTQVFWNDYTTGELKIFSVGRCPYIEYKLDTNTCQWEKFFLDTAKKSGSKFVCVSDYEHAFGARVIGITIQMLIEQDCMDGCDAYKESTIRNAYKASSAFMVSKAKEYSDLMIKWETDRFGNVRKVCTDEGWERKQSNHGSSHALNNFNVYYSGETGMPLDYVTCTIDMIKDCDDNIKVYHEWENTDNPYLKDPISDFKLFTNRYALLYAAKRFPGAYSYVFDGCSDNVCSFYNIILPTMEQIKSLNIHPFPDDIQCEQSFDGFHAVSIKYKRLEWAFPKHCGIYANPVQKKLWDLVFDSCLYLFSQNSEDWYTLSVAKCMENVKPYSIIFDRECDITFVVSEKTMRRAIRGSGSTTYLNWKGEKFDLLDYCIDNNEYYFFDLKISDFIVYRQGFSNKFSKDDFEFFLDILEVDVLDETSQSDKLLVDLFQLVVEDITKNDYSGDLEKRKTLGHFFQLLFRVISIDSEKCVDVLVGDELCLILKSFKKDYDLCPSVQKGGVKVKKDIVKGDKPYIVNFRKKKGEKKGKTEERMLPCKCDECHHFVTQYVLEEKCGLSEISTENYEESLQCYVGTLEANNVKRCPKNDYGYFNTMRFSSGCEKCFSGKVARFPKFRHKTLINYDGDAATAFLRDAHAVATTIRIEELVRGIDVDDETCFWCLGNPNNFWGGRDATFVDFLKKIRKEFLERADIDGWYQDWFKLRGKDINSCEE